MLQKYAKVPKVEIQYNSYNEGIYPSWNKVIRETTNDILLLGSDTESINYNWFSSLHYFMCRHPKAGFVAGKQVRPHSSGRMEIIYGGQAPLGGHPHLMGWLDHDTYIHPKKYDHITHSQVLIRREVFDSVGLYNTGFKIYCGDTEFSNRAVKAGFECWFNPDSVILHHESKSVSVALNKGEISTEVFKKDFSKMWGCR
jgi:GT2 family glycosyltransferase